MRLRPEQLDRFRASQTLIVEDADEDIIVFPEPEEEDQIEAEEVVSGSQIVRGKQGVAIDFDPKKMVIVTLMFIMMFVVPVGLYQNRASFLPQQQVYTQSVTDQSGRVAGVATNQQSSAQTPTPANSQANQTTQTAQPNTVAGIPLSTLFIVGGIFLILVPVIAIWRL